MNAFAQSATLSSTRSACDRGAGVLPDGLILSSIVVGIGLFTGWKRAPKWSFATALLFLLSRRLKANL
jgi:hypothetical protein